MSQNFFPETGKQVVPIWPGDDHDGITFVQARENGSNASAEPTKIRILRLVIGSFLKATVVRVDSKNVKTEIQRP